MDRFQHIEEIFQQALQRDPAQRDAFVREACQGDAALHREVSSLLANHEEGGVESWAAAAAARLMAARGSLDPGTSLGSYRIERFLAAGGMGEVYGAHDTKLGRQVAIKILPDSFTHDPERLARFRREAHVLAALNHPHIGAIYGLEEANGRQFLVLELIDGETLADRLTRGRLSVDDSLAIARQIADALESAHEKGIVHRDLKPSNVALTHDGTVKVLDFGLAKITDAEDGSSVDRTITSPGMETGIGVILGTAAYMSPEQARGRTADKRSDIWAFGCVLYEMLTGKPAFGGDDVSDTLAAVLRGAPDWTTVPAEVPRYVRTLLVQCLEKNRAARVADVAAVRFVLAHGATLESIPGTASAAANVTTSRWPHVLAWSVAATCTTALVLVLGLWPPWRQNPATAPMRMSVELGNDVSLANTELGAGATLSPDGSVIAFAGRTTVNASLAALRATPRPTPGDALGRHRRCREPVLFAGREVDCVFRRRQVEEDRRHGRRQCDVVRRAGRSRRRVGRRRHDRIFARRLVGDTAATGVVHWRNADTAGARERHSPSALASNPARAAKPCSLRAAAAVADFNDAELIVQPLPGGAPKVVHRGGFYGRYLPSGHLLYVHAGTLWAAPFDLDRLAVSGPPVPVIEGVTSNAANGGAQVAVSASGTLVYLPGQEHERRPDSLDGSRRENDAAPGPASELDRAPVRARWPPARAADQHGRAGATFGCTNGSGTCSRA